MPLNIVKFILIYEVHKAYHDYGATWYLVFNQIYMCVYIQVFNIYVHNIYIYVKYL